MFIDNYATTVLEKLTHLYTNPYVLIALTIFLLIATYTDVKERKIPNWLNLTFIAVRLALIPFIGFALMDGVGALFGLLVVLIPAMISNVPMGGDIKASFVLGLYLGFYLIGIFILLSGIMLAATVIISFKAKGKMVFLPFAPFFLLTHIGFFIFVFFI